MRRGAPGPPTSAAAGPHRKGVTDEAELEALDWRPMVVTKVMRMLERLAPFREEEAAAA